MSLLKSARLVGLLADKADPFTKVRLLKLAEKNMTSSSGWCRSLHVTAKYR
jgi:hypothetical protein